MKNCQNQSIQLDQLKSLKKIKLFALNWMSLKFNYQVQDK